MRRRKAIIQLTVFVALAVLCLVVTLARGNTPLLGLDLQGGVSVVLSPKNADVGQDELNQAIEIMRQRIDAMGVAEPEITRQGNNILINIAGVKDTDKAIEQVGQTAELRFRPVLQVLAPDAVTAAGESPPGTDVPGTTVPGDPGTTVPGDPAATTDSITPGSAPDTTVATTDTSEGALGVAGAVEGESAAGAQATPTTAAPEASDLPTETTAVDPTATTTPVDPTATTIDPAALSQLSTQQTGAGLTATPPDQDERDATVVLPEYNPDGTIKAWYQLGPTQLTGSALEGATAGLDQKGKWTVYPKFRTGADGIDAFNTAAQVCKPPSQQCPTGQQAIVLDSRVISAPQIQPGETAFTPFSADGINISGSFDQDSANALATALKYGSLPIELERQSTQIVSATLGLDALHAGLVAGLVGLILAGAYMIAFYRVLGVMAILKLGVEAMFLYSLICFLGSSGGLALTLAGVTGIIVSIGVSLDSNVVYYEHLREDIRHGRTIRSAVDRSFHTSMGTILKADGASILGAALLYFLAVGPVRGFAFFLGVSTILDVATSYFYMRPVVFLTTSTKAVARRPAAFGLPKTATEVPEGADRRGRRGTPVAAGGLTDDEAGDGDAPSRKAARTGAGS